MGILFILKNIDFGKYKINYICVKRDSEIRALLESKGYKTARKNEMTEEFYFVEGFANQY